MSCVVRHRSILWVLLLSNNDNDYDANDDDVIVVASQSDRYSDDSHGSQSDSHNWTDGSDDLAVLLLRVFEAGFLFLN